MVGSSSLVVDSLTAGNRALEEGRFDEAIDALTKALSINPHQPDAWFNLAWAQRASSKFTDALDSYAGALQHSIARPEEAHMNRAVILSDHLGSTKHALLEIESALRCNPNLVDAWLSHGQIYEDAADEERARESYGKALELSAFNGRALARLAAMDVRAGRAELVVEMLGNAVSRDLKLDDRAEILFALGGALDAKGAYSDAFDAFGAANLVSAALSRRRYDALGQERLTARSIATFRRVNQVVKTGEAPPVFICGMFRSGSTLVESVLSRHSGLLSGGEREAIPAIANGIDPYPDAVPRLSQDQVAQLKCRYLELLPCTVERVIDKRCDNFQHIGLIKEIFPDAKIIHSLRNPLDNLLSIYFLNFNEGVTYGNDLSHIVHYFAQYRQLMAHWLELYHDDIFHFDYDRFVVAPEDSLSDLLKFLGLPLENQCFDGSVPTALVRSASTWEVRRPVHSRSSGRWRNYIDQLASVRKAMEQAGIEAS
jgi:tetratricopeptide (TPR) repeat protein